MEDWSTMCGRKYHPETAWGVFQAWRSDPSRAGDFLEAAMPLMGSVLRSRFKYIQHADREDICSCVSVRLLRKVSRHATKFDAVGPAAFSALLSVTIRNLTFDHLRCNPTKETRAVPGELWYRRPQLSVSKAVDLRLMMEDLPAQITDFAVRRDRLGYGKKAIQAVVRVLLTGKSCPVDMLRNWLGVENPERCIAFVMLMARWFLYKYRDKFAPVLEGELLHSADCYDGQLSLLSRQYQGLGQGTA